MQDLTYTNASGTTVDGFTYTYDQDDNVLSRRNATLADQSELYTYDGLNRLTTFTRGTLNGAGTAITGAPTGTESWNLDAVGNWNSTTKNGTTTSRTNNAQNQIVTAGSATLNYDQNGNTLKDEQGQQYTYDAWNRLKSVKDASGNTLASYTYDAKGRRATETHGSTTTALYYDQNWQVIEEREGGVATKQYVWDPHGIDQLVARDDHDPATSGTTLNRRLYAEQDANGNVVSLTDASGTVVERYAYSAYGVVVVLNPDGTIRGNGTASASAYGQRYLHQGLRFDPATGTYYNRDREYDADSGRFVQQDPAGFVDGANRYQVDASNSLRYADPLGLSTSPADDLADQERQNFALEQEEAIAGSQLMPKFFAKLEELHEEYLERIAAEEAEAARIAASLRPPTPLPFPHLETLPDEQQPGEPIDKALDNVNDTIKSLVNQPNPSGQQSGAPRYTQYNSNIRANKAAGDAWEKDIVDKQLPKTQSDIETQVTVKSSGPSGERVRLDAIGTDKNTGGIRMTDGKASQTATLTPNQKIAYPELQKYGGVVVGNGKGNYPGGTKIPPTPVDIIRKP